MINKKLEEVLKKYGLSQYDSEGLPRTILEFLDDIYLLLSPDSLLEMMEEISQNSLEIFGGRRNV